MDKQTLRFVVISAILYGVFHFAYHQIPFSTLSNVIYPRVIGEPAVFVINSLTPDHHAVARNNSIRGTGAANLNIVKGCDGSGVLFMICAAVLGFGASIRKTLYGLFWGILLVYVINQIRIIGLFYVVSYNRHWFPPVHTYYAPTLIVILIAAYFLFWTRWAIAEEVSPPGPSKRIASQPVAGALMAGKKLGLITLKALVIWFALSQAGQLWGDRIIRPFIPLYTDTVKMLNGDISGAITIEEAEDGAKVNMEVTTIRPIPVTPTASLDAGTQFPVSVTLLHQLVPMVILLVILTTWPVTFWKQRLYMLLLGLPAILLLAAITTPMQLLGMLEIGIQNYSSSLGYIRDEPRVLTWMLLTEGGARWFIPVLLGVLIAVLVRRKTDKTG